MLSFSWQSSCDEIQTVRLEKEIQIQLIDSFSCAWMTAKFVSIE